MTKTSTALGGMAIPAALPSEPPEGATATRAIPAPTLQMRKLAPCATADLISA